MNEKRGRGRPRDVRVEAAVVEATLAEIEDKGLRNATMEAIAVRAGIGKATLYRRWPNKESLLYFLADQLAATYEPVDTGDLRKDLLALLEPHVTEVYKGPVATLMPTFIAEAARDPRIRAFIVEHIAERRTGAKLALQRARDRGEVREDVDFDVVLDMIHGALEHRFLQEGRPVTLSLVNEVVDLAVAAISVK